MKNIMKNLIKKAPIALALALTVFAAVSTNAATLRVDPDATGCTTSDLGPFATIQGALSAAGPGDTIFVCPNYNTQNPNTPQPYAGPIVVSIANLTLIGVADPTAPGDSRVLIQSNAATPADAGTGESRGIVTLDATGITFGNFTVDGGTGNAAATAFNGIVVTDDASGSTVFNTSVQNITVTGGANLDNLGNGIVVEGGSAAAPVSILNNTVSLFRSNGIFVGDVTTGTSGASRALVRGNYINGNSTTGGAAPVTNQRGIVFSNNTGGAAFTSVGGGTTGDIFNNRIQSLNVVSCPSTSRNCSEAIGLEAINGTGGTVTVRFNVSTRNVVGIFGTNTSNVTFNNNTVVGNPSSPTSSLGLVLAGSDGANGSNFNIVQLNVFENNVAGAVFGLMTLDTSAGNTFRQNTVQDSLFGLVNFAISTTIGSGATANTFIQVDNFVF